MSIKFNHTIIHAKDAKSSARFLAELLGLPSPTSFGPFIVVKTSNDVSLDFIETSDKIMARHFAFLVSESEFDEIFKRIKERKMVYWADPERKNVQQINHRDGGRGCYFLDPNGHFLEIITRSYGSS